MNPAPAPAVKLAPLRVPLKVDQPIFKGQSWFQVWDGDSVHLETHERKPGFWSPTPDGNVAESALRGRLSDTSAEPTLWHRLEFQSDKEARFAASAKRKDGLSAYVGDADRWATRIVIEDPDFFPRFPMSRPLRIMTLDIEQYTEGRGFPPQDNPMISCAFGRADGSLPVCVVAPEGPDGMPDDSGVVAEFKRRIQEDDPDIIVAFNAPYDTGVFQARAALHGFPLEEWGRVENGFGDLARSHIRSERVGNHTDEVVYVGGRIVWDITRNCNPTADYNLSGVKDGKLKTISKFLGYPDVVEEDVSNTAELWRNDPERLARYNVSDVVLLERLVDRYIHDRIALAEFYGASLDMTLDAMSGWSGTIASGRILFELGIVADGTNMERNENWLRFIKDPKTGKKRPLPPEGATVTLHQSGLFEEPDKADFASLYPNVIIATRCGPDNTRIVGTRPLGEFAVEEREGARLLVIPDANYQHSWEIEVRGESAFTPILSARMAERLEAKRLSKEAKTPEERRKHKARANILKTQLNAMFGTNLSAHNRYGTSPVGIIAMGFSRVLIAALERAIPRGKIETDTDGVYCERAPPKPLLERAVNRLVKRYGFEPRFTVDIDHYKAAWFNARKSYLLLTHEGKVKRYGQGMKGSTHPALFDDIVMGVGRALLEHGRKEGLRRARVACDLSQYSPRQFVQRTRLSKPIADYPHKTLGVKVALAYQAEYGDEPRVGTSYEYVRTRAGNVPPTPENLARLDEYQYLSKVVVPALGRLGFSPEELGLEDRLKLKSAQAKRPQGETSLSKFL